MLNKFVKWFFSRRGTSVAEQILSTSTDLADLERKQRHLMRKGIYY